MEIYCKVSGVSKVANRLKLFDLKAGLRWTIFCSAGFSSRCGALDAFANFRVHWTQLRLTANAVKVGYRWDATPSVSSVVELVRAY